MKHATFLNILITGFLILVFHALLQAQVVVKGDGKVVEQTRQVSSFDAIEAKGGLDVYITQGNTQKVTVEADGNLVAYIRTEVKNDVLYLYVETTAKTMVKNWSAMKVHITTNQLSAINSSGGTDIFSRGELKWGDLEIQASGGSDVTLDVSLQELVCKTSGGADVTLQGATTKATLDFSGGSDFIATKLQIENAAVTASGGSDAYIYVTKNLHLQASGASDVYLYGNPAIQKATLSGASDLHRKEN